MGSTSKRRLVYRPALAAWARLHFAKASPNTDVWQLRGVWRLLGDAQEGNVWDSAESFDAEAIEFNEEPATGAGFAELPAAFSTPRKYAGLEKQLRSYLFRTQTVKVWYCSHLKTASKPDEAEGDFRARLGQQARDREVEKLRKRYAPKLATIENQIRTAEEKVAREKSQYEQAKVGSAISVGASILGAIFGRKLASAANVQRTATSMRSAGRALGQKGDIATAEKRHEANLAKRAELETEFEADVAELETHFDTSMLDIEPITVPPRKTDFELVRLGIAWLPHWVDEQGLSEGAWE